MGNGAGGTLDMRGSPDYPAGSITTIAGGDIDTLNGFIELGPKGGGYPFTKLRYGSPTVSRILDLPDANGTLAVKPGISTLSLTVSDPPTQSEMQQIADKLDQLITALG